MNVTKSVVLVTLVIGVLFLFGWLYRQYQTNKKLTRKHLIVAFLFAFTASQAIGWVMKETGSFEAAVQALKEDESIQNQIGKYNGYSYNQKELPSPEANPAEVKLRLNGNKGSVYVHCRMELDKQGKWILKEIIQKEEKQHSPNTKHERSAGRLTADPNMRPCRRVLSLHWLQLSRRRIGKWR